MASTFRNDADSTYSSGDQRRRALSAAKQVADDWDREGIADLPAAVTAHPSILTDRSVFLDLVQKEFRLRREEWRGLPPTDYCARFDNLDNDLLHTLHKLIEVEQCLGDLPIDELIGLGAEPDWPSEGELFGEFYLAREIGRGAVARVFLCRQASLGDREVVVKVTRAIGNEASVLGTLNHPCVMPVHSVGEDEATGLGWICMPFHGSWTLHDAINRAFHLKPPSRFTELLSPSAGATSKQISNRLPYEEGVLRLFARLADGLAYVHSRGLLHGDLKGSNVLLTDNGTPMQIDFNLSQRIGAAGLAGGTLPHMAPEQLAAVISRDGVEDCRVTTATEVFAFGVLFYQTLVGRLPFTAATADRKVKSIAQALLDSYAAFHHDRQTAFAGVDPRVARFLLECLAENPADRPANLETVHRRLTRLLSPVALAERFSRRRPKTVISCAVAAMLLASGLAFGAFWPSDDGLALRRAQSHADAGRYREAAELLKPHLADVPNDQSVRRLLAASLLKSGEPAAAAEHYVWLWRESQQPLDAAMVGYCHNRIGKHSVALAYYREVTAAGLVSAAVENNLAASLLIRLGTDFDQEVSDQIEQHLLKAYELDAENETIRLTMLRHYLLGTETSDRTRPSYSAEIASFASANASKEFCIKAARFLVLRSSSTDELRSLGIPCLRRLTSIVGFNKLPTEVRQPFIESYQALPEYANLKTVPSAVEMPLPSVFLSPETDYLKKP